MAKVYGRLIWCRLCQIGLAWLERDPPPVCPSCHTPTRWSTESPQPMIPWRLTARDAAELKAYRIAPQ